MRNKTECALVFGSVLYLCLFLFNSMTRTFGFPADSMNYVNVARNITQGLGISQSTLGFNQTLDVNGSIPTPMTSQAPLYPLLIAWVHKLGVEHADAALVLPVVAYAAIMALGFFLGSICYGRSAGLLSVAYLSCYGPLRGIARHALSDSLGIAFVLFALVLLFESR